MRQEKFVTQGAFTAALLCKADQGVIKSQRWKLDLVCKLLISAGILEDDADKGGLCVREQEGSKPSTIQQAAPGNDNTAYLEECLAHTEEEIARVEKVAMSATTEAQRAVAVAAEASARSQKATTQCVHVNERFWQVEEKCRQAGEKCQQTEKKCCDRLDESLEESGERIETNSTRIFHLANEMEGLAKSIQDRKVAATPLGNTREETGKIFSVELANLPAKQEFPTREIASTAAVPPQQQQQQAKEKPRSEEKRQRRESTTRRETKHDAEETHEELCISRREGDQDDRALCRPGVLDEPSPESPPNTEADNIRANFLTASLMQAAPPRRRRHSTYVGRRAAMLPGRKESAASGLIIGPVRPQEDRPTANQETPSSWARASSWPLFASEDPSVAAAARQMHDRKACREQKTSTYADSGTEENTLVRRGQSTPSLELALAHGGLPRRATTNLRAEGKVPLGGFVPASDPPSIASRPGSDGTITCPPPQGRAATIGDHANDLCPESFHNGESIAQSARRTEGLSGQHQGTTRKENRQPPLSPSQRLERMTRTEAAEALLGASTTAVATRRSSRELMGTDVDSLSARAESPGTRLACLGDTPDLWCPRDTWDDDDGEAPAGSLSSDGSSTAIAVSGGREEDSPKAEALMTGRKG